MKTETLTPAATAYFRELALDIADHGGLREGQSMEEAVAAAHERRQAFRLEVLEGKTARAQAFRAGLAVTLFTQANTEAALEKLERTLG